MLELRFNKIGDEGAKALTAGVAASGSTATLNLSRNTIGAAVKKSLHDAAQGHQGFTLYI